MKHIPSKTKVFQSSDYKLFENIDGNRQINKKKIARIMDEIKSGNDILDEVPVLVKELKSKLQVLDGQHRVEIAKILKRPVNYIIHKEQMSMLRVARVNSNTEKWKAIDFVNCYAKLGDENYIKLGALHKKYNIAVGTCLSILTYGIQKHDGKIASLYAQFEAGTFQIVKYSEAVKFAEICKSFSAFPAWNTRGFMIAISKILIAKKCEMDVLLEKFTKDPKALSHHFDWKGFISNLEEIYNKGNSKRRTIY